MRLDQFLKISRLVPRRSVAQEFCDAGLISVNGVPAKSSKDIKPGDEIAIRRSNRVTTVLLNELPASKQISKTAAGSLYQMVNEVGIEGDLI